MSRVTSAVLAAVIASLASDGLAQARPCEAGIAAGGVFPTMNGQYVSSYVPQLEFGTTSGGHAGQTLLVKTNRTVDLQASFACFPSNHLGLEAIVDFLSQPDVIGAANSPYRVRLEYLARQPPDYVERAYSYERSATWPDTTGRFRHTALSFNAVLRSSPARRWIASAFGGLSYLRSSGELRSIGYTAFRLGGHSVLFPETYQVALRVLPQGGFGVNTGGSLQYWPHSRVGIRVGYQIVRVKETEAEVRVRGVLNADQVVTRLSSGQLEEALQLKPLNLSPSFSHLGAGLVFRF